MPRQAKVNRDSWLSCHFYKRHSLAHQPFGFRQISASSSVFETVAPPTVAPMQSVIPTRVALARSNSGQIDQIGNINSFHLRGGGCATWAPANRCTPASECATPCAVWRAKRLSLCSNRPGGGGKETTSLPLRFRSLGQQPSPSRAIVAPESTFVLAVLVPC